MRAPREIPARTTYQERQDPLTKKKYPKDQYPDGITRDCAPDPFPMAKMEPEKGEPLTMEGARAMEKKEAGSPGAKEVCTRVYDSVLRENYPDAKKYMAMLGWACRRRILNIVFEQVKYAKGTRPNCNRDEKLYYLLGIVPVRASNRAGTGAVK